MNLSLHGKTAVVCGSSQGIGLACAKELALLGANCILLARNADSLHDVINQLHIAGDQSHHYAVADFSDIESVRSAITEIVSQYPVEILINNSGGPAAGLITEAAELSFIDAFNQHLICNHLLTQAVIPGMKAAEYGRIINIISTSIKIPLNNLGVSNTIRGAVASWAKTMANELGQYNITVNNILPGLTSTQRLESLIANTSAKKKMSRNMVVSDMLEEIPMKRFGDAAETAAVVAFLASPAASYVNGTSIPVDGGKTGSI
ncbi:MAG: SDR family oxidoreductase [Bacteroidota bacterium]